jgi:hypothetical protein
MDTQELHALIRKIVIEVLAEQKTISSSSKAEQYAAFKRAKKEEWDNFLLYIIERTKHFASPIVSYDDWLVARYQSLWDQYEAQKPKPIVSKTLPPSINPTDVYLYLVRYCKVELPMDEVKAFCRGEYSLEKQGIKLQEVLVHVKYLKAANQL